MATRFKPLTAADVTFSLRIELEDVPVKGAFASGDDAADKRDEEIILERLRGGDTWAWCCVFVTATWRAYSASDNLGCCSYADEADFKQEGGYYEDMCDAALARLNANLEENYRALATRVEVTP
jgi:hypothetical protein